MFIEHLALTYKCHSSIGNCLDLKKMLTEVLTTFVQETNALNAFFYLLDEEAKLYKYLNYKEDNSFDVELYRDKIGSFSIVENQNNQEENILILPLNKGIFFMFYTKEDTNYDFIGSMFQDLVVKLNISIDACLSVEILKKRNDTLDHLATELNKQKKELIESDKYKSNFLANMSHELKTPLNSIIVISSIMAKNKKEKLDQEQVKNMKIINSCGNDLLVLINDILDISKIEAGEISINLRKLEINDLINELVEEMSALCIEKQLNLEFKALDKELSLLSDDIRIKQIIKNLLSNAIKFTSEGTITVLIEENANDITIKVVDEGIGISADKLDHIFDRFKQADGSTTRKFGGTGLGLAISKELASLLGGDIKAFSKVDEGSTFELILPKKTNISNISDDNVQITSSNKALVDEEQESDEIVLFDMEDFDLEEQEEVSKLKVLIIDNDYSQFFAIAVALKKEHIFLEYKDSINEAKTLIEKEAYSLVVIHKEKAKADVEEFSEFCKKLGLKVIVLSEEETLNEDYLDISLIKEELFNVIMKKLGRNNE